MSGLVGGEFGTSFPTDAVEGLSQGSQMSSWLSETGGSGLGLGWFEPDPGAGATWTDGTRAGVVDGVVTNLDELGWSVAEMFRNFLDRPAATASALEGGFVVAYRDPTTGRHLVATDKLGTRPLFYTDSEPVRYASSVGTLLQFCDDPFLNLQAASDMLLMGHLWGNHTLVKEVLSLRPATVLEATDGERSFTRYWKPDYTERAPGDGYVTELVDRYRQAVQRTTSTLPARAGLWLSGGLDSRTTASALARHRRPGGFDTLETYTYDANPPTNDNPRIARQVAEELGVGHTEVPLTAETVGQNFERIVEATDGMLMWTTAVNLAASYEIDSPPPVLMEGMQGALLGDHLYRHHLHEFSSAVDSQLSSEGATTAQRVRDLLSVPVDPLGTFETEASRSPESTTRETVLDVHFQNYYSRLAMPSNRLMRDRVGTRVVHADGEYLEWCAKLPRRYRKGAFRAGVAPDGGIPYEPTRAKLAVLRRIDPDLADIVYERTKMKPAWPYPVHVLGFIGNVGLDRLRSQPTYGNGQLADFWIRDTGTQVHEHVTRLIDDACSRDLFDADAVREVYDDHMDGQNNASMLSRVTTLEHWIQAHLD